MQAFALHPQLAADCHHLGTMETSEVLLMDNALVPWFILVPRTAATEFFHLDAELQYLVMQEINALSSFLMTLPAVEKINLGALGNLVPQLHIHVIGRNPHDYCWPAPVWGQAQHESYPHETVSRLSQQLAEHASQTQVHFTATLDATQ